MIRPRRPSRPLGVRGRRPAARARRRRRGPRPGPLAVRSRRADGLPARRPLRGRGRLADLRGLGRGPGDELPRRARGVGPVRLLLVLRSGQLRDGRQDGRRLRRALQRLLGLRLGTDQPVLRAPGARLGDRRGQDLRESARLLSRRRSATRPRSPVSLRSIDAAPPPPRRSRPAPRREHRRGRALPRRRRRPPVCSAAASRRESPG